MLVVGLPIMQVFAQHLHLTYSSERHIHPGGNTSYHTDGRLPSRLEHILLIVMEDFPTFIQAGTHPAHNDERLPSRLEHILLTVMRDFSTYI